MKKSDLKLGDIIERRNGSLEMYIPSTMNLSQGAFICKYGGYNQTSQITDDMKNIDNTPGWDIVNVRRPDWTPHLALNNWVDAPLIWKRTEPKKVTMKQICEAFNCDEVEIVGEKEIDQNVHE